MMEMLTVGDDTVGHDYHHEVHPAYRHACGNGLHTAVQYSVHWE